jgi:hypothetical protein
MPIAYLPEHTWQVGGGAMAVVLVALGLSYLVGRLEPRVHAHARTVRQAGAAGLAVGVAVAVAAALVNAEPPDRRGGDQWGGLGGVAALLIWLILLGIFAAGSSRRPGRG